MKKIQIKQNINIILLLGCLLLVSVNFTSCDFLRQTKRKIKGVLFGTIQKDNVEKVNQSGENAGTANSDGNANVSNESDVPTTENGKKYDNTRLVEITDLKKIINLCNAFIQNPNPALKETLFNEIRDKGATIFNVDNDKVHPELSSCMYKFIGIFENDQSAIEIIFEWYSVLTGKNKKMAGEVLSRAFDFHHKHFMKTYFKKMKKAECYFLATMPPEIEEDQKDAFFKKRIEQLIEGRKILEENTPENLFIETCIDGIRNILKN